LLRSPLHGLLSGSVALVEVRGSKSGRAYAVPVNYVLQDHTVLIASRPDRTWWRNIGAGTQVGIWLRGRRVVGHGTVVRASEGVAAGLSALLQVRSDWAKYYGIGVGPDGEPDAESVRREAARRVLIRISDVAAST
jgi:hypothetical protein